MYFTSFKKKSSKSQKEKIPITISNSLPLETLLTLWRITQRDYNQKLEAQRRREPPLYHILNK